MEDSKREVLNLIEDMFFNVLVVDGNEWDNEDFDSWCCEYELTEEQQELVEELSYHVDEIIKILK